MVETKDIVDRESLERWLKRQPPYVWRQFGHRLAMRNLPTYLRFAVSEKQDSRDTLLGVLRGDLISELGSFYQLRYKFSEFEKLGYELDAFEKNGAIANSLLLRHGDVFWDTLQMDAFLIEDKQNLLAVGLWHGKKSRFFEEWVDVKLLLSSDDIDWTFWTKWYEASLNGEPLNYEMLERVALIPSEDWEKGPAHVNALIAEIEGEFEAAQVSYNYTKSIQQAVAQNKAGIAPQIEALTEILSTEIEKLRGKNPADEIEQEENKRLMAIFEGLQVAIVRLGALIPNSGEPSHDVAEEMEGLLKVYVSEFQKWPRENAADMVDSTVRVALVGMTAGVVTLFGASALVGVAIGGIAFGGKKLAGAAKALKDSSSGGS